jgi:hypothetical protein
VFGNTKIQLGECGFRLTNTLVIFDDKIRVEFKTGAEIDVEQ